MEWQPIETAPKDGRMLLVFDEGISAKIVIGRFNGIMWEGLMSTIYMSFDPTHWMPLPQPPAGSEG